MTHRTALLSVALLISVAAVPGCRRKIDPAPAPATTTPTTSDDAAARRRADSLATAQRHADSLAALQAASSRDEAATQQTQAEMRNTLTQRVYFDFDRDQLRDDAIASLDGKAAILLANPGLSLVVTGHTDERGTSEYNLALGQRRAAQVKRYLAGKGVSDARLASQSLGDSQPAARGGDEAAYQQNRRAEFEVRNAPAALVRPRG